MRFYPQEESREQYLETQIAASKNKFRYCKVSYSCVERFKEVISCGSKESIKGPILCLGTRNGREIDLFRIIFFGSSCHRAVTKLLEVRRYGFSSRLGAVESLGRSDVTKIDEKSVVGAEINPEARRRDVFVGSFDELPAEWSSKFKIIYANTLDHSQDPHKTAKEWLRVIEPGGYIVLGNGGSSDEVSAIGRIGNVSLEDIRQLFPGELIYFNKYGNWYADVIVKKNA